MFPESPEVLPYRCGVVQGEGSAGAAAGGAGCDGGGGVGWRGVVVVVARGVRRWGLLWRPWEEGFAMACVGGGIDVNWLVLAAACCVRGLVSGGGGRRGVVWGWRCWWWGGQGWVLCWLGVWASLWVVWVLRVCAVRPLRFLTGCGAGVWVGGGRMSVRVGLWSVCIGWLLVDGARWYGVWVGGLLVVVGRSY